jgi:hypothetical protein
LTAKTDAVINKLRKIAFENGAKFLRPLCGLNSQPNFWLERLE